MEQPGKGTVNINKKELLIHATTWAETLKTEPELKEARHERPHAL